MKKILIIVLLILIGAIIQVSADEVKVTMKNGTVFTGELKEFVPTDHVTVVVAGIETRVPISEVESVEKPEAYPKSTEQVFSERNTKLQYGKYAITDTKEYPDSFVLRIGDQKLTMVLVRGGWFNMGYDGRHSLSWDSEPIHRVTLSSYYVSKQYLNCHVAKTLLQKKTISNSVSPFNCTYRKDAEDLINRICILSGGAPYRLLTEAEWEYASLMPFANILFRNDKNIEWCSDFFEKYSASDQINPQGPRHGTNHVLRSYFFGSNEKWRRIQGSSKKDWDSGVFIRIAINADQIKENEHCSQSLEIPNSYLLYGKFEITDTKQYPDSFVLKIGNQELTMILIRGGWFNMGYDGEHSSSWNTEPVHKVNLSSYYICKQFISYSDAHAIINVKESNGNPYPFVFKKDLDSFVGKLVKEVGMPLRMPTEAEWEYASLMPFANNIFLFGNCYEWCSDYWGDFTEEEKTNPQGPSKGKTCVMRCFSNDNRKWRRTRSANPSMSTQSDLRGFLRLTISADSIDF